MIITEIYIKNFGMLSDRHIRFTDDVQIIYGENESGKSTLHAFIRAMLFGMERGRGKAATKDDFTRYEPWGNPEKYAGVLWFSCGGKRFRLERNFSRYMKRASLICEDDGEELSVEDGDLEMLLGDMTASLYDSTVSVGQLAAAPGQELSRALENYAANFCEAGGGDIDVNGALRILRERRKEAERALKKERGAREEKRQKLLRECSYLEKDMSALSAEFNEKKAALESMGRTENPGSREEREFVGRTGVYAAGGLTGMFIGVTGFVWAQFLNGWKMPGPGGALLFFSVIVFLTGILLTGAAGYAYLEKKRAQERTEKEHDVRCQKREGQTGEASDIRRVRWEIGRIQAEWKEKEIRCGNLREHCAEIESEAGDAEKELAGRCRALQIAEEQMRLAADSLGKQTAGNLNEQASQIFAAVTEGKYQRLDIGEKLQISVWDGIRRIPAERLSRGTLEQIYFSVRMAAADILQEEPMPVILDDTFAFYDEKRLKSALKWLRGQKRQVIILSCNKREEEILKQF